MANMSYCRFQNTLSDLYDCYHDLEDRDGLELDSEGSPLSDEERYAAVEMIQLCIKIVDEFGDCE